MTKKISGRRYPRVVSKGKKPPESGIMKPKMPMKTTLQKMLDGKIPKGKYE